MSFTCQQHQRSIEHLSGGDLLFYLSPFSWCKVERIRGCLEVSWLPLCLTVLGSAGQRHCQITIMFSLQSWREMSHRKLHRDPGPSMSPAWWLGTSH